MRGVFLGGGGKERREEGSGSILHFRLDEKKGGGTNVLRSFPHHLKKKKEKEKKGLAHTIGWDFSLPCVSQIFFIYNDNNSWRQQQGEESSNFFFWHLMCESWERQGRGKHRKLLSQLSKYLGTKKKLRRTLIKGASPYSLLLRKLITSLPSPSPPQKKEREKGPLFWQRALSPLLLLHLDRIRNSIENLSLLLSFFSLPLPFFSQIKKVIFSLFFFYLRRSRQVLEWNEVVLVLVRETSFLIWGGEGTYSWLNCLLKLYFRE